MKKHLLSILFVLLGLGIFTSCQKSSSSPSAPSGSYYVNATINGNPVTYSAFIVGKKLDTLGIHTLTIDGLSSLSSQNNSLILSFGSVSAITTGTYTSTGLVNELVGANVINNDAFGSVDNTGSNTFSATITALTSTYVTGTFSGIMTDSLNKTNTYSGSFYSPVQ